MKDIYLPQKFNKDALKISIVYIVIIFASEIAIALIRGNVTVR